MKQQIQKKINKIFSEHNNVVKRIIYKIILCVFLFQVPVIENSVCQEMFHTAGHNKKILPSFLCAGYANGQKDSCEVSILQRKHF